ncbi:MAG: DUF3006 domain-containing protein [Oscillospiraceae bacterium]|nr:DUF3006 domain-containing protein [Oscillospiraceae bacterium]
MYIIDRFEEDLAVLETEDGGFVVVPRAKLSADAAQEDCLREDYSVDAEETARRRAEAAELTERLRKK